MRGAIASLLCFSFFVHADPSSPKSGPQPGQRTGPYSALVSVGKERGTQHCYICEADQRPTVIVFARSLTDPLGKLVHKLDQALTQHKDAELRTWVTFLADDHVVLDPRVIAWSKQHATGNVPLGVFEDPVGPPSYLIARDAEATVLLSVQQKVVANFAFRAGELNDAGINRVMKSLPRILGKK